MIKHLAVVSILAVLLPFQGAAGASISSAVLEGDDAKFITRQCSRAAPEHVEGNWVPSAKDVQELEKHIELLKKLESGACCGSGKIEGSLSEYFLQYAGIMVGGRKLIYINAYPKAMEKTASDHAVIVCGGGGKRFWGAIYDPETRTFNSLAFNGVA